MDRKEKEQAKLAEVKKELKEREQKERLLKGKPGKGVKQGYKAFCKGCFTEFMIEVDPCPKCNRATMSYEVSYIIQEFRMFQNIIIKNPFKRLF